MTIRHDQLMGLNSWAKNFVNSEPIFLYIEEVTRVYPDGRRVALAPCSVYDSAVKKEKTGEYYSGMFGNKYALYKYTFPAGQVYFEKVQEASWSSGPVFFLALQDENRNWLSESLWTEEGLKKAK